MSTREATFTESDSVVHARPRIREEVREELREEIKLLEMPRITAPDKLRMERQAVEGAVGDVELFERSYRRTTSETLAEVERAVEALGTSRPSQARPPAPTPTRPPPGIEVSDAPASAPTPMLGARLTPTELRAIEQHLGGTLLTTEVLFNTTRSRVVEVAYRGDGQELRATVVVGGGEEVATLDEIGAKLDGLALPAGKDLPEPEEAREPPLRVPVERLSQTERRAPIETVEGIGSTYGQELRKAGIAKVEQFFVADPAEVAARTGLNPHLVRKWHDQVLLQAIDGIGPQFSELLVRAGVRDLRQMAEAKPASLAQQLNAYEASLGKRVQGRTITSELAEDWVRQAKEIVAGAPMHARTGPAPVTLPKKADEPEPEEPKKKGFGLKLGKRKEEPEAAAAEPEPAAEASAKKGFGLRFGKKKAEEPEASPEATAEEAPKRKFGLSLGKKPEEAAEQPSEAPAEGGEEPKRRFGLKLRK
ncbi:MAG: DUF4332 domain-containing protein [Halobacteriales archaeon]|nr:DUF4332 domain-containing protein [Halobacteriales archaeon]